MVANRMQIKGHRPAGGGSTKTSGFTRPRIAFGLVDDRLSGYSATTLAFAEVIYANSARLNPKSSLVTTYNTLFNNTRTASNGYTKCLAYQMWFENGGQTSPVGAITRLTNGASATGISINVGTVVMNDTLASDTPDSSLTVGTFALLSQLTGSLAVYNGEWKVISRGTSSVELALDTTGGMSSSAVSAATSSTATGSAGGKALVTPRATNGYSVQSKLKDNPTWYFLKNGNTFASRKTAWNTSAGYRSFNMNFTSTCIPDSNGQHWFEWYTDFGRTYMFDLCDSDGVFIDNYQDDRGDVINNTSFSGQGDLWVFDPSVGTMVSRLGSTQKTLVRQAYADLADYIRSASANPASGKSKNLIIMGNYDGGEGSGTTADGVLPEAMNGNLDYAFLENVFDNFSDASRSSQLSGSSGFTKYFDPGAASTKTKAIQNYVGKVRLGVAYGIAPATWDDHEVLRFATGMCWLSTLAVPMTMWPRSPGGAFPVGYDPAGKFLDEWFIAAGDPVGAWPTGPTLDDPNSSNALFGLWTMEYENMLVMVNAGTTQLTYTLPGSGWKMIAGTTYPSINTGASVTQVIVPPWSCRIVTKYGAAF